ncbi:hypothetical protein FSP39_001999 [Pinctada imbricata]|uniref:CUB domain-containing protein n=1 Tax=Pinctada imbricata TaxID=66713 RepID=A0AA89C6C1_PINIB|nr:hypothetical protein FSP39_001999 [Pinctada imbricata]
MMLLNLKTFNILYALKLLHPVCVFPNPQGGHTGHLLIMHGHRTDTQRNQTCNWLLTSKTNNRILYHAYDIDVICPDGVSIHDGPTEAAQQKVNNACRDPTNSVFSQSIDTSSGTNLLLKFMSDGGTSSGKGFSLFVISAPSSDCTENTKILAATKKEKVLTSPMFPDKYQKSKTCNWMIMPESKGSLVKLDFKFVDIDYDSSKKTCHDKVEINYGNTTKDVCGSDITKPVKTFTSEAGSNMTLTFITDSIQEENGFVMVYMEVDGMMEPSFMQKYFMIIIIVVVIVAVIIIAVVIVAVVCCCKRKKKSSKNDDVYNPEEVKLSETPTD